MPTLKFVSRCVRNHFEGIVFTTALAIVSTVSSTAEPQSDNDISHTFHGGSLATNLGDPVGDKLEMTSSQHGPRDKRALPARDLLRLIMMSSKDKNDAASQGNSKKLLLESLEQNYQKNEDIPYRMRRIGSEFLGKRSSPPPSTYPADDYDQPPTRGHLALQDYRGSSDNYQDGDETGINGVQNQDGNYNEWDSAKQSHHMKRKMGSEFLGKRAIGNEFLGKRAMGSEFLGKRAMGSEFLGKRAMGTEFLGKRAMGSEFLGKRAIGNEFLGKRGMGSEFLGKRAMGSEFLGKRALGNEFLGKRSTKDGENPAESRT